MHTDGTRASWVPRYYPETRTRRRLPLLYAVFVPLSGLLFFLYRQPHQFTDKRFLYALPLWFAGGIVLCVLSFLITGFPLRNLSGLLRSMLSAFTVHRSIVQLQAAFLISLLEEMCYRYFLLLFLSDKLRSFVLASLVTSALFTLMHFCVQRKPGGIRRYADLFIFSLALCLANIATRSFYPAFILHGIRNYVLRVLLVPKVKSDA